LFLAEVYVPRGTATHQARASARQGETAVIENRVTSDDSKLIREKAASLDGPGGPPTPEPDDGNELADYWQALKVTPWFFPAVPRTFGNSYRAGDE
jgi:hypothetical protein